MATIKPTTGIINSVRNQGLGWHTILCEMIDNSFDAGAKRVEIRFDKTSLTVSDDGSGCADLLKMLTLGDRHQQSTTMLGKYGVGAKDAAISAADGIYISSVHRGIQRVVSCNWKQLEKHRDWEIVDPTEERVNSPSGTLIELRPLRMKKVGDHAGLIRNLSRTYSPAIKSGRQIVVQCAANKPLQTVPEFPLPELEHQITADLNVFGKLARITMGLIPDGSIVENGGITITSGYRVIREGQRIGLGSEPTPSLFGLLELYDGWELTKNKHNLSENIEPLGNEIARTCRDVIELATRRAANVLFDDVGKAVSDVIDSVLSDISNTRKEKRLSTRESQGTVMPTGTGSPRRRARLTQPGGSLRAPCHGRSTAIRVGFRSLGPNGPASQSEWPVVYLNRDIPIVAEKMNDKDALSTHAVYAASAYLATNEQQLKLPGMEEDPADLTAKIAYWVGTLLSRLRRGAAENSVVA